MKKQMQIRIYPDGKIDAKTIGIKGEKCTNYIEVFEKLLESRTVESSYTEEYYQSEAQIANETNIKQNNK